MSSIDRLLGQARLRIVMGRSLQAVVVSVSCAATALVALRLSEGWFGLFIDWPVALAGAGGIALFGAMVWGLLRAEQGEDLARVVDENAGLRETISTAVVVRTSDDPWNRAVLADAERRAALVDAKAAAPIASPRWWWAPLVLIGAVGAMLLFDPPDLRNVLGGSQARETPTESEAEVVAVKAEIQSAQAELERVLAESDLEFELPESLGESPQGREVDADSIRRSALREMTSVRDELERMRSGERAQSLEQTKQRLRRLRQPGPGPAQELARAMARGEFDKAQEELSELAKQLRQSELSPEQQKQLQEQLENLSQQLESLSQDQRAMEQALKQAGISPQDAAQLARDPNALEQALQNLPGMSPQQAQSLMDQANANQQSSQSMQQMSQAAQQMCDGMQQGENGQGAMGGMDQMSDQLSEMEMLSQEMQSLDSAMASAQSQMSKLGSQRGQSGQGQSMWSRGESSQQGQGSGGPGQGSGNGPEERETSASLKKQRSPVNQGQGPIIASRLVYEGQVRGESRQAFSTAAKAGAEEATEAIESMRVPREYHDVVKRYFGSLEARADDDESPPPADEDE